MRGFLDPAPLRPRSRLATTAAMRQAIVLATLLKTPIEGASSCTFFLVSCHPITHCQDFLLRLRAMLIDLAQTNLPYIAKKPRCYSSSSSCSPQTVTAKIRFNIDYRAARERLKYKEPASTTGRRQLHTLVEHLLHRCLCKARWKRQEDGNPCCIRPYTLCRRFRGDTEPFFKRS